ncbi:hypothetical protein AGMMS49579_15190 [Spirochaetia bacterium]|nr:hypothetical protein AGMMS49579_15190 [Spirochaetia bacterium]
MDLTKNGYLFLIYIKFLLKWKLQIIVALTKLREKNSRKINKYFFVLEFFIKIIKNMKLKYKLLFILLSNDVTC